jgi:hypothetical protein
MVHGDMTAVEGDNSAALFVTNVLNGTVAGGGGVVNQATVVRILLDLDQGIRWTAAGPSLPPDSAREWIPQLWSSDRLALALKTGRCTLPILWQTASPLSRMR